MEHDEVSAPVESAPGGGGEGFGQEPPPWLDGVQADFSERLGRHQEEEPFEPRFEDESDFEDDLGPEGEYRPGDDDLEDDFDLEAFADEFAPEAGGDDDSEFLEHMPAEFRREAWKQQALDRLDGLERQVWEERLDALVQEIPALERPEVAMPVFEAMGEFARELELPDNVALDPRFARMTYLAMRAEAQMAREKPVSDAGGPVLEMGGVADPGPAAEENVFLEMAARPGRNPNKLDWPER